MQTEEVEEKANAVLPSGMLDRLADPKWKERLEACEEFKKVSNLQYITFTSTTINSLENEATQSTW